MSNMSNAAHAGIVQPPSAQALDTKGRRYSPTTMSILFSGISRPEHKIPGEMAAGSPRGSSWRISLAGQVLARLDSLSISCALANISISSLSNTKKLIIREGVLIICNRYMKPMFVVFILFTKIVSRTSTYAAPNAEGCWWSVALVEMFVRKRMFSLIPSECVQ